MFPCARSLSLFFIPPILFLFINVISVGSKNKKCLKRFKWRNVL